MRQAVADHRQSKFDWGWKYRGARYQGNVTLAEVLSKCKFVIVKRSK